MARRRYDSRTKAKAVGIAVVEGVTEAERQTGIPKVTVWQWMQKPEYEQLRTNARDKVADDFWVGIQVGLDQVVAGIRGDAPLKDKAAALGIIYDRHALLTGGATGRTESRELVSTFSDGDLIGAVVEADSITSASGASPPGEDPPEG